MRHITLQIYHNTLNKCSISCRLYLNYDKITTSINKFNGTGIYETIPINDDNNGITDNNNDFRLTKILTMVGGFHPRPNVNGELLLIHEPTRNPNTNHVVICIPIKYEATASSSNFNTFISSLFLTNDIQKSDTDIDVMSYITASANQTYGKYPFITYQGHMIPLITNDKCKKYDIIYFYGSFLKSDNALFQSLEVWIVVHHQVVYMEQVTKQLQQHYVKKVLLKRGNRVQLEI